MISKIYSRVDPSIILHIIYQRDIEAKPGPDSITDSANFLQAIAFNLPSGYEGKRHKHNHWERKTDSTHEALLVFKGSIELFIYDIDESFVEKKTLNEGDCYVIINGGHSIKSLVPSQVYEFKNGPYGGPEKDKTLF
jgi:hypothetical protein